MRPATRLTPGLLRERAALVATRGRQRVMRPPIAASLVERDPNPLLFSPSDMASAQKIVAFNDESESIGNFERICDFDACPGRRYVADGAGDATAIIKNDGAYFQGPIALSFSTFGHGQSSKPASPKT